MPVAIQSVSRGFAVDCILCGAAERVTLALENLSTFHCDECAAEFELDDVRVHVAAWSRVIAWIDAAPEKE